MKNFENLSLKDIIKLTRASEKKYREGNFRGAFEDKMEVNDGENKFHKTKLSTVEEIQRELEKDLNGASQPRGGEYRLPQEYTLIFDWTIFFLLR